MNKHVWVQVRAQGKATVPWAQDEMEEVSLRRIYKETSWDVTSITDLMHEAFTELSKYQIVDIRVSNTVYALTPEQEKIYDDLLTDITTKLKKANFKEEIFNAIMRAIE